MTPDRGSYPVTCRHCQAVGVVVVKRAVRKGSVVVLDDRIQHLEGCCMRSPEQPRHLKRKKWVKQEARANKLVGARATLASGAVGKDGDGRSFHLWRVESKQTVRDRYLLRQDVWDKLVSGALLAGEEPLLHVQTVEGTTLRRRVVIRKDLYDAWSNTAPRPADPKRVNRLSYGLSGTPICGEVPLDPAGVELPEETFTFLKEAYEDRKYNIREPSR